VEVRGAVAGDGHVALLARQRRAGVVTGTRPQLVGIGAFDHRHLEGDLRDRDDADGLAHRRCGDRRCDLQGGRRRGARAKADIGVLVELGGGELLAQLGLGPAVISPVPHSR